MSVHAVRRRLIESQHRLFIEQYAVRMRRTVVVEALVLAGGDEAAVSAAIDYIGILQKLPLRETDYTRLLAYLRRDGAQL